jgi:hypothetical protein
MSNRNRQYWIDQLDKIANQPGGSRALQFTLNSASGAIPIAGGILSAIASELSEAEQEEFNTTIAGWAKVTDRNISELYELFEQLRHQVTPVSFSMLIAEVIGRIPHANEQVPIILNPTTIEELQPYKAKGWIQLHSTGSICSIGTNCRVGNHIEDLKRPYGMGNGFIIVIPSWNIE